MSISEARSSVWGGEGDMDIFYNNMIRTGLAHLNWFSS